MLSFVKAEPYVVFLDSNQTQESEYKVLCAIGAIDVLSCNAGQAFDQLRDFQLKHQDWMFGYLGYDLKNELEPLESKNQDRLGFQELQFFVPATVIELNDTTAIFHTYEINEIAIRKWFEKIRNHPLETSHRFIKQNPLQATDSKKEYLYKAQKFLSHIQRGDIYEANLCTEFYAQEVTLDPIKAFEDLNDRSQPPFAAYVRMREHYIISASPERYLKKTGVHLVSQPIKGTAARSTDISKDDQLKQELYNNQKERSENVMIVDLVRNDLSRVAKKGSVQVTELFGLYTFLQVHHMISTVTATLDEDLDAIDAIKATFPMGSMTGAPKISAMKIIEQTESFKRGVYSGAIGYIDPQGDFDFNVVIRTILYNHDKKNLSLSVGSAITIAANPAAEYKECFVKASALMNVLKVQGIDFDYI